ncbi:MAG: HAD family hydrolase, partial [Spirochaetota bacterium]
MWLIPPDNGLRLQRQNAMSVVFIDLDGTVMRNPFRTAVFPVVCEYLAARTGLSTDTVLDMIMQENTLRLDTGFEPARAMDWDEIAQTVARRQGVVFPLSLERLVAEHCHPPHIAILEGADSILGRLATKLRRIVAASHGLSKYQLPVLKALGLLPMFAGLATPDTTGCLKSQRGFWRPYIDQGGLCIHVGDLYHPDVLAAKDHGLITVWKLRPSSELEAETDPFKRAMVAVLPTGESIRPDAVVVRLDELPEVVVRIEAAW